jgi:hypothetical protein
MLVFKQLITFFEGRCSIFKNPKVNNEYLGVSAIDIFLGQKLLDSTQVSLLGSIQKC